MLAADKHFVDIAEPQVAADRRSADRTNTMTAFVTKVVDMEVDTAVTSMSSPYNGILKYENILQNSKDGIDIYSINIPMVWWYGRGRAQPYLYHTTMLRMS